MQLGRVLLSSRGPIEKHASKIYTLSMYTLCEAEIFQSAPYRVEDLIQGQRYLAIHYDGFKRSRWSHVAYEVTVNHDKDVFNSYAHV